MVTPKKRLADLSRNADKFLDSLPPKHFKQILTKALDLRKNPMPNDCKKMVGFENKYRVDIGEYRIIYSFDDLILKIELIGKRNDDEVYQKLKK